MDSIIEDYNNYIQRLNTYFNTSTYSLEEQKLYFMDYAIKFNDLNFLKYLYDKNYRCTSKGFDYAAFIGNIDIILWLLGTQHDCSVNAIDYASIHGHLNIIELLVFYGKPYTNKAIYNAITNGHLDIIKYFHEKLHIKFNKKMLNLAKKNNHDKIVEYIEKEN